MGIPHQSFLAMLEMAREGTFTEYVEDKFEELNTEVVRLGKKGSLTIKVVVDPEGGNQVEYAIECETKLPKRNPTKLSMWVDTKTGKAAPSNPTGKQAEIPVDELGGMTSPRFRVVD